MPVSNRAAVIDSLVTECGTPFYLLEWQPLVDRLATLEQALQGLPAFHLFSFKTCPVPALLQSWHRTRRGVEVVSEFELQGALRLRFQPADIVVNGVAKHRWLSAYSISGITVNFDSLLEVAELADLAAQNSWRIGLRFHPQAQRDPDDDRFPDQFGLDPSAAEQAVRLLRDRRLEVEVAHVHLGSNLSRSRLNRGLREIAELCLELGISPRVLDCGGGLPAGKSLPFGYRDTDPLTVEALATELRAVLSRLPSCREVWLENGRYLLAAAGTLIVRVRDVKDCDGIRFLICDGGRTNHALVSDWEPHELSTVPLRDGRLRPTVVCGPTCMAYDWLVRGSLSETISVGDLLAWHDAGAYHIPWETRFSHGLVPVVYVNEQGEARLVRRRESFSGYWDQWIQ